MGNIFKFYHFIYKYDFPTKVKLVLVEFTVREFFFGLFNELCFFDSPNDRENKNKELRKTVDSLRKFVCKLTNKPDNWYSTPQDRHQNAERIIVPNPVEVFGSLSYEVKTPSAKQRKIEHYGNFINDVEGNQEQFGHAFDLHHHIQKAKDVLVNSLGNPTEFEHTMGGKSVKPEGFVAIRNGRPTKLVDRAEFSRNNFANNRGRGETDKSEIAPINEEEKHHVFAFGRMNPPTVGHGALVDKVKELARLNGANHSIVLSRTQDSDKNPLSPEQKLKHAQRMFPNTNISVATRENPTFMHHLKELHKQGVTHVTMVAGSDRVDEYKRLLDRYNGPGKEFNFKQINVVSAGHRDPDAEGVSGMSASKMREHAKNGNFNKFRQGLSPNIKPEHAEELYNDVRTGQQPKPKKQVNETISLLTHDILNEWRKNYK